MKFYSKVKKRIKLGFRTPNLFRRNIKHKITQKKYDIIGKSLGHKCKITTGVKQR